MNRSEKATLQLHAVAVLRTLKRTRTYDDLAVKTGLTPNDLNRYVNGHVLPSAERARELVEGVGHDMVITELERRIQTDDEGYVDNTDVVFDARLLKLIPPVAQTKLGLEPPDAVLTAATDGITLATAMADYFGATVVYAKKTRETAVEEFIESRQRLESGIEIAYYLPTHALAPAQKVLVVDDLIRSGETQELLLDIAEQAGTSVSGVFTLIAAGRDGLSRVQARVDSPVGALTVL
jgi:adenine phosphoribosyltransferase